MFSNKARVFRHAVLPVVAGITIVGGLATGANADVTEESPAKAKMELVTANGTGCAPGTWTSQNSGAGFTISFSNFQAAVGGDAKPVDFRKNCQLAIRIDGAEGYQYGLKKVVGVQKVDIAKGASLKTNFNQYFQGESSNQMSGAVIEGPYKNTEGIDAGVNASDVTFSPCGENRLLNINSELRLAKGDSTTGSSAAVLGMAFDAKSQLVWRKCEDSGAPIESGASNG